jgi:hypothetical protein
MEVAPMIQLPGDSSSRSGSGILAVLREPKPRSLLSGDYSQCQYKQEGTIRIITSDDLLFTAYCSLSANRRNEVT